jgi:uncharacterized membrane protein
VFCAVLLFIRVTVMEDTRFLFLLINLGLAWVPFLLSQFFKTKIKVLLPVVFFFWLLFFPNALYIVTDLFQLWPRPKGSVFFDLVMILSFSFVALFLGLSSLKNIEDFLVKKTKKSYAQGVIFLLLYLGSFGVYFGRFRRWNSWDVITSPRFITREGLFFFENPLDDIDFYATTFVFALFTYIIYYGLFHFAKNH